MSDGKVAQSGYYFDIKHGQYSKHEGGPTEFFRAGGLSYIGGLTKEQHDELTLLVENYVKNRDTAPAPAAGAGGELVERLRGLLTTLVNASYNEGYAVSQQGGRDETGVHFSEYRKLADELQSKILEAAALERQGAKGGEPVAWRRKEGNGWWVYYEENVHPDLDPLYPAAPRLAQPAEKQR